MPTLYFFSKPHHSPQTKHTTLLTKLKDLVLKHCAIICIVGTYPLLCLYATVSC